MKLIDLTCPKCGATMQVNTELSNGMCNHCGYSFIVDEEVKRVEIEHKNSEQAGYEFEQGRMRAQAEAAAAKKEEEKVATGSCLTAILAIIAVPAIFFSVAAFRDESYFTGIILLSPLLFFIISSAVKTSQESDEKIAQNNESD